MEVRDPLIASWQRTTQHKLTRGRPHSTLIEMRGDRHEASAGKRKGPATRPSPVLAY
jgi:hypothetical protein